MALLVNAVFLVLLSSVPALARRGRLLKASLEAKTAEDNTNLAIEGARKSHHNKESSAHKATQAARPDTEAFAEALKAACNAIYAEAKARARALLYKSMEPGSEHARESKKNVVAAAARLRIVENMLWEQTELLAGEAFGGEAIVNHLLEDYAPDSEKEFVDSIDSFLEGYVPDSERSMRRLLKRFHQQIDMFELEKLGFKEEDVFGMLEIQARLSALNEQVEAMQGQEVDSDEIDLTRPSLVEKNAMYLEIVKVSVEYLKIQLVVLRMILLKNNGVYTQVVQDIELPARVQNKVLIAFLNAVSRIEQRMAKEYVIKKAVFEFCNARISTLADFTLAKQKLEEAAGVIETFDPKTRENKKAMIKKAITEKHRTLPNVPK